MSIACDPIRSRLNAAQQELSQTEKFDNEPIRGEPHPPKPVLSGEWKRLTALTGKLRRDLQACEEAQLPKTPVPLTLTLSEFVCLDQSDEIDLPFIGNIEDDEPYALAFVIDLKAPTNSKMSLVGALADVNEGTYAAPANTLWGLSDAPALISAADDFIVLVAMMENDSGSPAQARTVLELAARSALLANLPAYLAAQIPRQELVNRVVAGMDGAMGGAKAGVPNPDDTIGPIQQLRFAQSELDHLYRNLGPIVKSLSFSGDDASYRLNFRLFR